MQTSPQFYIMTAWSFQSLWNVQPLPCITTETGNTLVRGILPDHSAQQYPHCEIGKPRSVLGVGSHQRYFSGSENSSSCYPVYFAYLSALPLLLPTPCPGCFYPPTGPRPLPLHSFSACCLPCPAPVLSCSKYSPYQLLAIASAPQRLPPHPPSVKGTSTLAQAVAEFSFFEALNSPGL